MKRHTSFLGFLVLLGTSLSPIAVVAEDSLATPRSLIEQDLFVSGEGGYHTYRIPSIVMTNEKTLLAFCEGRKDGSSDKGDIDLLLRRSTDGGKTWSPIQTVWNDQSNTCGNPCSVVDRETGTIWLLSTWNLGSDSEGQIINQKSKDTRRVYAMSSSDDGVTWTKPHELTTDVKLANWTWYATGPGCGIQKKLGPYAGRLLIPCDHIEAGTKHYDSHAIVSDDHGKSWRLSGTTPDHQVNECEVVELSDGRLMLNMRNYDRSQKNRQTAISEDGGETWKDQRFAKDLIDPICQASIRRLRWPTDDQVGVIVFSNAASETSRTSLTIRASMDDGQTWKYSRLLYSGGSAYSCLCALDDQRMLCLYEKDGYKRITLAQFDLDWIRSGNAP